MHKDLNQALGETLRSMRVTAGLTQTDACNALNVSQPTVARWESGSSTPGTRNLVCATTLYGSTPAALYSAPVVQEASEEAVPDQIRDQARLLAQNINQRHGR